MQRGFKSDSSWVVLSLMEAAIKNKIEAVGTPLKEWDIHIYRGILTGYNDAFIIDKKTRDALIASSPKNDEIIRPILLGKNIKRYNFNWDGKWIIFTRRGIDIDQYPAVKQYLYTFYDSLRPRNNNESTGRKPGPYKWFEIQDNVAYYKDFDKQKIAWGNLALNGQFAIVDAGFYINAPSAFIATEHTYLAAILNSKLADFYIKQLGVTRSGGYFEYKPMFVEKLPVPKIALTDQTCLLNLMGEAKQSSQEEVNAKIDQLIYEIYELTEEEASFMNAFKFQ